MVLVNKRRRNLRHHRKATSSSYSSSALSSIIDVNYFITDVILNVVCNLFSAQFLQKASSKYDVSLICTFSEDTGGKKQGIQIFDDQKDNALQCQWREEDFDCSVGKGYTYDFKLSGTATVTKRSSQEPETSTCSCIVVDPDYTLHDRPCTIEVHEISEATLKETAAPIEDSHSRRPWIEPSEDSVLKSLQLQQDKMIVILVTLSVTMLLIVSAILATVIFFRYGLVYCGRNDCEPAIRSNSRDPEAGQEKKPLKDPDN